MKKTSRIILMMLVLITVFMLGMLTSSVVIANTQPGSQYDPLVTKSYVDEQIQKYIKSGGSSSSSSSSGTVSTASSQEIDSLKTDMKDTLTYLIEVAGSQGTMEKQISSLLSRLEAVESGYSVVKVNKGDKLIMGAGSELVLRSGTATAIKGPNGGLVDTKTGSDLNSGDSVGKGHLLISSRYDGRGIQVTSDIVWLLVRGTYSID